VCTDEANNQKLNQDEYSVTPITKMKISLTRGLQTSKAKGVFWVLLTLIVLSGYIMFTISQIRYRGLFEYIGIDFRLWYATGLISKERDLWDIYDLSYQSTYQKIIFEQYSKFSSEYSMQFFPLRFGYLPIYVVLFKWITDYPIVFAFILWGALNAFGTAIYLSIWIMRVKPTDRAFLVFCLGFCSIYSYLNLIFGQINLLLLVLIGETLHALESKRDFIAGILLSLCLIKPQIILPLFPIVAILLRRKNFFLGLLTGMIIVLVVSFMIGGFQSAINLFSIYKTWPPDLNTSGMTWKALVMQLEYMGLNPYISLIIGIGIVLVSFIAWGKIVFVLEKERDINDNLDIVFGSTILTQFIISPYGNVHMALPLIVFWYKLLNRKRKQIYLYSFLLWSMISALVFLILATKSVGFAHDILGRLSLVSHILMLLNYLDLLKGK